jgi:hypothetical protein
VPSLESKRGRKHHYAFGRPEVLCRPLAAGAGGCYVTGVKRSKDLAWLVSFVSVAAVWAFVRSSSANDLNQFPSLLTPAELL